VIEPVDLSSEPPEGIEFQKRPPFACITLDRPDRGNALTVEMHRGMRAIWNDIADDDEIRVVIITGRGQRHFCTGIDVRRVAETGRTTTGSGPIENELFWTARQNQVWKPVICAVNGTTAGAGLHFVADADIVVAAQGVTFLDTHVNLGMVGGVENVGLLARLPLGAVLQMTLMGREHRLTAERAHVLGLVDEVVAPDALMTRAEAIAAAIAQASPAAVSRSLQAVWNALELPRAQAEAAAWTLVRLQWGHPDFVEGPRAFAENRAPTWSSGSE
jgi:E-phenylitaconyl-CoA hydratase